MADAKLYAQEKDPLQWELEDGESPDADESHLTLNWLDDHAARPFYFVFLFSPKPYFSYQSHLDQLVKIEGYFPPPDIFGL